VIELRWGSATDVGMVRTTNQDQLLVAPPLFAVADGMGGAAAGDVAATIAVESLKVAFQASTREGEPTEGDLIRAAEVANRAVWEQAESHPAMRGMGTTLVALAKVAGDRLAAINVGDSRLYALHHGELQQVSEDHSLVAELVAEGRISKEEAEIHPRRNIMTRALGVEPEVPVDLFRIEPDAGDRFLLCSDGLSRELADDHIAGLLRRLDSPEEAARELVAEANRRGGSDNITVVIVDVVDPAVKERPVAARAEVDATHPASSTTSSPARGPRARLFTLRVVAFLVVLMLVIGGAVGGIAFYARDAWFVGLKGDRITFFRGRPGGFLWFEPTVSQITSVTTLQVEPRHFAELSAGQPEPSISAARQYVTSLVTEEQTAEAATRP
jgi:serine/threonine protein phosphatase PrpC